MKPVHIPDGLRLFIGKINLLIEAKAANEEKEARFILQLNLVVVMDGVSVRNELFLHASEWRIFE
jgi:hypothetical protein